MYQMPAHELHGGHLDIGTQPDGESSEDSYFPLELVDIGQYPYRRLIGLVREVPHVRTDDVVHEQIGSVRRLAEVPSGKLDHAGAHLVDKGDREHLGGTYGQGIDGYGHGLRDTPSLGPGYSLVEEKSRRSHGKTQKDHEHLHDVVPHRASWLTDCLRDSPIGDHVRQEIRPIPTL